MAIEEKKRGKKKLTERKKQIIEYISKGYTTEEIACDLGFSTSLINSELIQMFEETGTVSRAHLVAWAYQNKIL